MGDQWWARILLTSQHGLKFLEPMSATSNAEDAEGTQVRLITTHSSFEARCVVSRDLLP